jgi:cardiolipin synthase (CMP-forming)
MPVSFRPLRFGIANSISLLRLVLIVPVVILLMRERFVAAALAYTVLILTDVVDGPIARARGETGQFGAVLDPVADIVSTFAVFTVFVIHGLIPVWLYVLLGVRYATLGIGSLALWRSTGPIEFRATVPGKIVGVVQAAGALYIILAASGRVSAGAGGPLFAFLGVGFVAIVVSQAVVGYRLFQRGSPRARG